MSILPTAILSVLLCSAVNLLATKWFFFNKGKKSRSLAGLSWLADGFIVRTCSDLGAWQWAWSPGTGSYCAAALHICAYFCCCCIFFARFFHFLGGGGLAGVWQKKTVHHFSHVITMLRLFSTGTSYIGICRKIRQSRCSLYAFFTAFTIYSYIPYNHLGELKWHLTSNPTHFADLSC